jgi:hypothetical protein
MPSALCRPAGTRPLGCAPLLGGDVVRGSVQTKGIGGDPLPCVDCGECPFVTFECKRQHTWKAVAGAPACFFCPECAAAGIAGVQRSDYSSTSSSRPNSSGMAGSSSSRSGNTTSYSTKRRRHTLVSMQEMAAQRGGECLSTEYKGLMVSIYSLHRRLHVNLLHISYLMVEVLT